MKYEIRVTSIMEYGQRVDAQGQPHQEDCIFPEVGKASAADRLFIVCDGMGGHDAGEVASATVCQAMSQSVIQNAPDAEGHFDDNILGQAISDAFDALDLRDTGALKKMGTTMTLLKLHDNGATIAHIGDSRVYHFRPGADGRPAQVVHVTVDHSLVNDLVKIGEITPEEAKTSRHRNVITRAMQPHLEQRPRADIYHTADIRPGDIFMLCTDGMLETDDDEQLCLFFDPSIDDDKRVEMLRQYTKANRDNHSAIIVHILDVIDPIPVGQTVGEIQISATRPAPTAESHESITSTTKPVMEKPSSSKAINNVLYTIAALIVVVFGTYFLISGKGDKDDSGDHQPAVEQSSPTPAQQPLVNPIPTAEQTPAEEQQPQQQEATTTEQQPEQQPQNDSTNSNVLQSAISVISPKEKTDSTTEHSPQSSTETMPK